MTSDCCAIPEPVPPAKPAPSYRPLALILGYISLAVALLGLRTGHWDLTEAMRDFMGAFFLGFAFFKLLDLRGFASAYSAYDLVARALPAYAYAYPFIELALGVGYLLRWQLFALDAITLPLMLIASFSVARKLRSGDAAACACLGTSIQLPVSAITLLEDLLMAGMAAAGLWSATR